MSSAISLFVFLGCLVAGGVAYVAWRLACRYLPLAGGVRRREAELDAEAKQRSQQRELTAGFRAIRAAALMPAANRALQQVEAAFVVYAHYARTVADKFAAGELTHGRYLAAGEQVFLACLANLRQLATLLQGLEAIGGTSSDDGDAPAKIELLLDDVDEALRALNAALAALAALDTASDGGAALDDGLRQLRLLAERVPRLS